MILDAGAFLAVERNDRATIARILAARLEEDSVRTHAMVLAQVWRARGGRQARTARLLHGVEVIVIDPDLGRRCGELLGKARKDDPIDAAVVLIARDNEAILTSDVEDIGALVDAHARPITVVRC